MHAGGVTLDLSTDAILQGVETYPGSIYDLDCGLTTKPGALAQELQRLAHELSAAGLSSGDRIVLAVANGPLFFIALGAILARGGTPLLAHPKAPAAELKRLALRLGARFIISETCSPAELAAVAGRAIALGDHLRTQFTCATIDEHEAAFQGDYPALPGVPLHPTSGTTGLAKVAARPATCALAEAQHYVETIGITADDVILVIPPMSHAYAWGMGVMVPLLCGASVVTARQFKPGQVLRALADGRITIFPAVPAMLDSLLFAGSRRLNPAPRCVLSAGAPLSRRTAEAFLHAVGKPVRALYGTTETGGITVAPDTTDFSTGSCVGPPMNGVLVEVRSPACCAGEQPPPGTLRVRSASMMAGYLTPQGIDDSQIVDGWFDTGDLATIDVAGAICLQGRASEMINVAGMKVVPREVEEVLLALPHVREVKVYAGRLASGSEFVKAAIVASQPCDLESLREHCRQQLVYYKHPSRFLFVDALAKTASGKVLLDQLP